MAARSEGCDRDRLRRSLDGRLTDDDQARLADHLEACPGCRDALERMAAASRYWGDAALLRGEPSPTGLYSEDGEDDDPDDHRLDFLDLPDPERPGSIGRLGAYDILEVLGRGGMGLVLKAHDRALGRTVAIKVLNPSLAHGANARRRFEREARAVAAVAHEHIVAIHAVDEFRRIPYLVMQYIPGRSLQEKLDASGPLEIREILRIGTQAARALAAAHAQGVVHRDIKPANILLENCVERVKLTDFGLARAIDDASLTHSGFIAGTPQYMAPEQARGESVDARADLFALGGALYAMAAGRSPFRADSAMAVLRRVCDVRHRPIRELNPDVPAWLEAVIDRLLAKEPGDRFQTAAEVADLLERGLAHLQQPTIQPPPEVPGFVGVAVIDYDVPAVAKRPPRAPSRLMMAATVIVMGVVGLGVSEASGLTKVSDFVATVLRIRTADGTLVVKVDDPNIKVEVDGDAVVIGGAGLQEVRVRAGTHRVRATKDGRPFRDETITIARGEKEIVSIAREPVSAAGSGMISGDFNGDGVWDLMFTGQPPVPPTPATPALPLVPPTPAAPGGVTIPVAPRSAPRKKDSKPQFQPRNARLSATIEPAEAKPGESVTLKVTARLDPGYHIYKYLKNDKQPANGPVYTTFDLFESDGLEPRGDWSASREPVRKPDPAFRGLPYAEYHEDEVTWSLELKVPPEAAPGKKTIRVQVGYIVCSDWGFSMPGRWTLPAATLTVLSRGRDDGETTARGDAARTREMVWRLAYSPDGTQLAIAQQAIDRPESFLRVWDVSKREDRFRVWHDNAGYRTVAFSDDGQTLAAGVFDGTLTTLECDSNAIHHENQGAPINALVFLPRSKTIAAGDWEGWVRFHGPDPVANRNPIHYPGRIWSLAISPDGSTLAVGGAAKTIHIYELMSRQLKATLMGHDHAVESLDFSPDGKTLVSAGGRLVKFWDTASWKEKAPQIQHSPEVICVKFSPDEKLLAISDGKSNLPHYDVLQTSIILWDIAAHAEVRRLWGHSNTIWALAFSPDGKTLASGGADQTVRFWDPATGRLRETLVPGVSDIQNVSIGEPLEGSMKARATQSGRHRREESP